MSEIFPQQKPLPGFELQPGEKSFLSTHTPRPDIASRDATIVVEPFNESEPFKTALAAYESSEKGYLEKIGAAVDIAAIVRKTVSYKTYVESKTLLTPEALAETAETNCYGYTIFLSQALEYAGIEHLIAYTNGHSFVLIKDEDSNNIYGIDSITRKFDGTLTDAVFGTNPAEQLHEGSKFAVNTIDTKKMLQLRHLSSKIDELTQKSPWISYHNVLETKGRGFSETKNDKEYLLQLITYTASDGRSVLQSLHDVRVNLNVGNLDASVEAFKKLKGLYPNTDPRDKLRDARELRTQLFNKKRWGDALAIGEVVDESLSPHDRTKNKLFFPETERRIANSIGQAIVMQEAIKDYEQALPRGNKLVIDTIIAAKKELGRLQKL